RGLDGIPCKRKSTHPAVETTAFDVTDIFSTACTEMTIGHRLTVKTAQEQWRNMIGGISVRAEVLKLGLDHLVANEAFHIIEIFRITRAVQLQSQPNGTGNRARFARTSRGIGGNPAETSRITMAYPVINGATAADRSGSFRS